MMNKMRLTFFFIIVFLGVSVGCSNYLKVSGTVTFDDGEPLTVGSVCFRSESNTFHGKIDKNGYYSPGGLKEGEGIPYGNYEVWISGTDWSEPIPTRDGSEPSNFKIFSTVASKYTSPNPNGLTFEAKKGGPRKFDIVVERAPDSPKSK